MTTPDRRRQPKEPKPYVHGISKVCEWGARIGPRGPNFARSVLTVLCRHAGEDGWVEGVTQDDVAYDVDGTRQAVGRAIEFLAVVGLLTVQVVYTDDGRYNRYRLAGVDYDWDWRRMPKDPNQAPTVMAAVAAVMTRQEQENERLRAAVRRMALERGEPAEDEGGGNPWLPPPPDGEEEDVSEAGTPDAERQSRYHEVTMAVEKYWNRIKRSPENRGGWPQVRHAVRWYMTNYDTAPEGSLSFLEQMDTLEREATMEGRSEDRGPSSGEEYVARSADPKVQEIWQEVLQELEGQLPRSAFQTWLKGTAGVAMDSSRFVIEAPTPFAVAWLERRMYNAIQKAVEKIAGNPLEVHFQVRRDHG